ARVFGHFMQQADFRITPFVSGVTPAYGLPGTTAVLSGMGFGPDPGPGNRATVLNRLRMGGRSTVPESDIVSWTDAAISFRVPLSVPQPLSGVLMVESGNVSSNTVCFRV